MLTSDPWENPISMLWAPPLQDRTGATIDPVDYLTEADWHRVGLCVKLLKPLATQVLEQMDSLEDLRAVIADEVDFE